MLSKANAALVAATGFAAITIYVVHHSQNQERKVWIRLLVYCTPTLAFSPAQRMRMGVVREMERQQKKEENIQLLKDQIALQRRLEERDRTK